MSREELDTISANALIKEHDDEAYWKGLPIIGHAELGTIRFTHRLPGGRRPSWIGAAITKRTEMRQIDH
jgi:hypothetical protein